MVFLKLVHTESQVNHKTQMGQGGPSSDLWFGNVVMDGVG